MNILRFVDYKNKKELILEFSIFSEAKEAALAFSKFINPDGNAKRPSSIAGPINHMNIYSDICDDFAVMLNVPTGKPEQIVMPNFDDVPKIAKTDFDEPSPQLFHKPTQPTEGIAVDCGSVNGKNPGIFEFRVVDISTKKVIHNHQIQGETTNNIAEYLAIINAIFYCKHKNIQPIIYSDSKVAIGWIKQKRCKTKFIVTNSLQIEQIRTGESLLRDAPRFKLLFWDHSIWTENPADYGRK